MDTSFKLISISIILAAGLTACDNPGSGERLGEKIDNSAERTEEKLDNMADRTENKLDRMGEKIEDKTAQLGTSIDDATITAKVKSAILAEPGLSALQINVDTKNGIVTLSGTVDGVDHREKANAIASSVAGVNRVENNLTLKASG